MSNSPLEKPNAEDEDQNHDSENPVDLKMLLLPSDELTTESVEKNRKIVFGELLRRILNELESNDLLECARLVSKFWRDESTWILRNRLYHDSFGTTFTFRPETNIFTLDLNCSNASKLKSEKQNPNDDQNVADPQLEEQSGETEKNGDENEKCVAKLREMLESCPAPSYFPTTHFKFQGGSLNCPQVLEFFTVYGKNIRKLTVDVLYNLLTVDGVLRQKILGLTPQLQVLEFMDSDKENEYVEARGNRKQSKEQININRHVNLRQGQSRGQGRGHLVHLKYLIFGNSIDSLNRIQILLKDIKPELPSAPACTIFMFNIHMTTFPDPDLDLDLDLFKGNVVNPINFAMSVYDWKPEVLKGLEKLAEYRFRFEQVTLIWPMDSPTLSLKSSAKEMAKKGAALRKIMDGTKDTLEFAFISVPFLLLLMRQPIAPGFFSPVNRLTLSFDFAKDFEISGQGQAQGQGQGQNQNQSEFILNRQDFFPCSKSDGPALWKNLGEIMPSLVKLHLWLADGFCEPCLWLPFLDPDAGKNPKVRLLILWNLEKREMLQKFVAPLPALESLHLKVCAIPPPSLLPLDSVENLIRWFFLLPLKVQSKDEGEPTFVVEDKDLKMENPEEFQKNYQSLNPLFALKSLSEIWLQFKNCQSSHPELNPSSSSSLPSSSLALSQTPFSNLCNMSRIKGEKWLLFHDYESCEEISSAAAKLLGEKAPSVSNSDSSQPRFPKLIFVNILCIQHKNEL